MSARPARDAGQVRSLRRQLLAGILLPVLAVVSINTWSLYNEALAALNTAYDRTLLASAKSIGESLTVEGYDAAAVLRATVPYSALEAFEADNQSRMIYRVSDARGQLVSGFSGLRAWQGKLPDRTAYAALVDFYDDRFEDTAVRVAVLLQPVVAAEGRGMAFIQVAETLELRHALARQILLHTLSRQLVLLLVIALLVVWVVQRATRPVRRLSEQLQDRAEGDLTPIEAPEAPRELLPMVEATNQVMSRLQHLLDHQKRFVRDASHQLRTPLAVLKTQIQSAQRGDLAAPEALAEMSATVDDATRLANQMLALAKVEQLRQQGALGSTDFAQVLRDVALDLSPLIAHKEIEFDIETETLELPAHDWMLRELARNLLHNAIQHSPVGGHLSVRLGAAGPQAVLTICDDGPGIAPELRARLFQPFSSGNPRGGSGLGLAICQEIVVTLGGSIVLENRVQDGKVTGLLARVALPLSRTAP